MMGSSALAEQERAGDRRGPQLHHCSWATGFPINVLNAIKMVPEVCRIFCATANPIEVIVAETEQGRGILGVIDGDSRKGVEDDEGVAWRKGSCA